MSAKYYLENREEILQRKHEYYDLHKEQLIRKQTQFYMLNRDKISTKNKRRLLCDCQSIISFGNYTRHLGSLKHQNYILNIQ